MHTSVANSSRQLRGTMPPCARCPVFTHTQTCPMHQHSVLIRAMSAHSFKRCGPALNPGVTAPICECENVHKLLFRSDVPLTYHACLQVLHLHYVCTVFKERDGPLPACCSPCAHAGHGSCGDGANFCGYLRFWQGSGTWLIQR